MLTVEVKGYIVKINNRNKEVIMKSNKLFEMLDKLDSFAIKDEKEEITIDHLSVFSEKRSLRVDLPHLPSKSFKIFSVNDVVIGFIYFRYDDCTGGNSEFFDNFNDDSETDNINKLVIQYKNGDLLTIRVHWNSLIYELDNEYFILLFAGEELSSPALDVKRN